MEAYGGMHVRLHAFLAWLHPRVFDDIDARAIDPLHTMMYWPSSG
jgi:hypothetical protein